MSAPNGRGCADFRAKRHAVGLKRGKTDARQEIFTLAFFPNASSVAGTRACREKGREQRNKPQTFQPANRPSQSLRRRLTQTVLSTALTVRRCVRLKHPRKHRLGGWVPREAFEAIGTQCRVRHRCFQGEPFWLESFLRIDPQTACS